LHWETNYLQGRESTPGEDDAYNSLLEELYFMFGERTVLQQLLLICARVLPHLDGEEHALMLDDMKDIIGDLTC
jgi:hypothetical protein